MKKTQKGFTLIELLVVIAIIGILAALVLVALGNARTKAQDARIKSNVSQYRTLGEVYYDANNASYLGFDTCITTPNATNCKGGIENSLTALNTDMTAVSSTLTKVAAAGAFCVSAPLKSTTNHVCNDSAGAYKEGTAGCGAATACP